jgi:hypothetical protein
MKSKLSDEAVPNLDRRSLDFGNRTVVLAVAERLMETPIDQIASYDALSHAAGRDVRKPANRWIIQDARRHLNRLHGVLFNCERGVGHRRLSPESGIRYAGEKGLKRTRNAARNGRQRLENALRTANDVGAGERRTANQRLAVFGLVEHLTKPKAVANMPEDEVKRAGDLDPLKRVLGI